MKRATLALALLTFGLVPAIASADTIMFSSGLSTPALRVTFDPQPEPPGISAGSTAMLALSRPVNAIWLSLLSNGSPLPVLGLAQLTSTSPAGAPVGLFGVRVAYGSLAPAYYLEVLFDPQPEPPGVTGTGKWALVAFDPQPEPPGRSVVGAGPNGQPVGFDLFISGFDPQPEPPGFGDRGFYWFYEGSIVQGQFAGATFALTTANGSPLDLQPVPEPATLTLVGLGLAGAARLRRRR